MEWVVWAIAFLAVFAGSFVGTRVALAFLRRWAVLDHPTDRSSHTTPTPRGGGLAVIAVVLITWAVIAIGVRSDPSEILVLCAGAAGLAALSWIDDLRGLPIVWRLLGQTAAVAVALAWMPGNAPYFAGLLPGALDAAAAAVLWIWFINLFNFMDGIDGIAGTESACLGVGVTVVCLVAGVDRDFAFYGLTAAAAALGFLCWNWHPAKIFFGDVGSVPLGFLLGWLLLGLAAEGLWAAALILPLYYLADATITLVRRAARGEAVWRAHRVHFYQLAVQRGLSHASVVKAILLANVLLLALAIGAAAGWPWLALTGACLIVATLLFYLGADGTGDGTSPPPPTAAW